MSKTQDLGAVSAYALAVEYGYQGTEAEWVAKQEENRVITTNARDEAVRAAKQAGTSEQNAELYSNNAEKSATLADEQAVYAAASAQNAEMSEQNASSSEHNAKTSETNAKASETSSAESAETAISSAEKIKKIAEQIAADREQINTNKTNIAVNTEQISKNKNDIVALHAEVKELKKKTSIDSYEELADAIASGSVEKYVALGDELMVNKITSLSVSSNNSNLMFSVVDEQKFIQKIGHIDDDTYVFEYSNDTWNYMEESVTMDDFGIIVSGTVNDTDLIQVTMNYMQISYTFVDFDPNGENAIHPADESVEHFAILEQTYVPDAFNFDAPESAICVTPGHTLTAGKYYIYNNANAGNDYWCNYKRLYYVFEIATDIVATEETGDIQLRYYARGDRETTGDARGTYKLTCKPYCCATDALYNDSTVQFVGQLAKPTDDYTDLRTLENFTTDQSLDSAGIIYNNLGHVCYGNNEWNVSNLRQRMQNTEKSMKPVRMHKNDIVTAMKNVKGFMYGLDPRFLHLVQPCIVAVQHAMNDEFARYELYTCEDTATLLSMKEMSFNYQTDEGVACRLYSMYTDNQLVNTAIASRAKARQAGGSPQDYRWARSALAYYSNSSRLVSPTGAIGSSYAIGGHRFAPAYVIGVAGTSKNLESAEA